LAQLIHRLIQLNLEIQLIQRLVLRRPILRRLNLCSAILWTMTLQPEGELMHGSLEVLPPVPVRSRG
jgi:hypothetical protein